MGLPDRDPLPQASAAPAMNGASRAPSPRGVFGHPGTWAGGLALVALLIVGMAPWTVSRGALRDSISAQIRSAAGVYVFPRGEAHLSLLPRPRVKLDDLAMVDANGALVVEASSMSGDIRLLPLLAGRLEVAEIALTEPRIVIDVDRAPLTTAGAAVRAAEAPKTGAEAEKTTAARLGVLALTNGTVTLRRGGEAIATAEHINARLDWRTVGAPAALTADLDWRGKRQQFVLWVSQPVALLRGGLSPVTLEARNAETTLTMTGKGNIAVKPRFDGHLQLATTAAADLAASLGLMVELPAVLDTASLDGDLVATPASVAMTNMRLVTGDETFEGTLALQSVSGGRPLLAGTLATQAVSLRPYFETAPALLTADGRAGAQPFDATTHGGLDLDIRLSAGKLRYGRLQASDAALSLMAKDGRFEASIADASAYGGALKARAVVAAGETGGPADLQATIAMRGVDWAAVDRDLSGQGRLTGTADVSASLQASGDSVQRMARSLSGQARINLRNGDLGGLDVPGTLARLDKRPLAAAIDLGSGRTRFDSAQLPFEISNGNAVVTDGTIIAPDFAMALAGSVQIPEGQAAMTATVRPAKAAADTAGFVFDVAGPWNRPSFLPDVRSLIRRSGAASPLFGTTSAPAPASSQ